MFNLRENFDIGLNVVYASDALKLCWDGGNIIKARPSFVDMATIPLFYHFVRVGIIDICILQIPIEVVESLGLEDVF